jgi:ATP-dependent RNA helicase DDX47/RRP3
MLKKRTHNEVSTRFLFEFICFSTCSHHALVQNAKPKRPEADDLYAPAAADSGDDSDQAESEPEFESESESEQASNTEQSSEPAGAEATFASLGLCDQLVQACKSLGWTKPSEIQRNTLPPALEGRDIIGLAETGSGKTGAFALPIIQSLLDNPQPFYALVLAPTRELAIQIAEQFEALGTSIGLRCVTVVGGIDMMSQAIALAKRPHVVVATPGRIVDHLENTKGFNLRTLKYLVFDEADRLLNMDFQKEIDQILAVIPREGRRTFMFSATMTSKVAKLQRASLRDPVKVEVSKKYGTVKTLIQQYCFMPAKLKDCYLAYVLNELSGNSAMVFTATCDTTQKVSLMLNTLGFSAISLHGKMTQPKRLAALNNFKSGNRNILIATDVASRGLDIPAVDIVINYDIPTHSKDYIHRVGRTARAGRAGRAISLVSQYDVELYQRIEEMIGQKLDAYPADEDAVPLLLERVSEAQRMAALELRDQEDQKKEKRKHSHDNDERPSGPSSGKQRDQNNGKKPKFRK